MASKVEQYIAETCKMQHSFAWAFRRGKLTAIIMAAKVEQYIAETCKIQQIFAWAFISCANRFFYSVAAIYCSFHSASNSCGSDEGSLQPSIWLRKLSSMLQKPAKCSTSLDGPLGVARIEFFAQFLQYTALSTQPAPHVAVMRKAYSHHYGCQSGAVSCNDLQNAGQLYMLLHE